MKVCKIFRFDAAHFLPYCDGKCKNMHGHSWGLEVEVTGLVSKLGCDEGMVVDFAILKSFVNEVVIQHLDHRLLNDIITNPTCENLLDWIADRLCKHNDYLHKVTRLRLYETPDSFAEEVYNAE